MTEAGQTTVVSNPQTGRGSLPLVTIFKAIFRLTLLCGIGAAVLAVFAPDTANTGKVLTVFLELFRFSGGAMVGLLVGLKSD